MKNRQKVNSAGLLSAYNSVLPSSARSKVTSSIYSRSPPTGTPLAILLTRIPAGLISLLMYMAVVSPSRLELVAMITSRMSWVWSLFISSFRIAQDLALAMEARCYHGGSGRTRMNEIHFHKGDAAAAVLMVLFLGIIIASRFIPAIPVGII